jgi:NTP pyrophosphatase (non-canonical NTP hydrolase)
MGKSQQTCGKSFVFHGERVIEMIFSELRKAEEKHPGWPDDVIHAVGILVEEAGEAMQAAIDHTYSGGDIERLRKELAQTGAMAIRALLHLP